MKRLYLFAIDLISRYALLLSGVFFAASLFARVMDLVGAGGLTLSETEFFGTDFLAFWTAASAVWSGDGLAMYDPEVFRAALKQMSGLNHGMLWLYPPTTLMVMAPFGLTNYLSAYIAFMVLSMAVMAYALRSIGVSWRVLAILLLSPLSIIVHNTGQVSFLMGALLIIAAFHAKDRPVLAGIAAGLLTMKPQLGILLPLVFAIAGCWRAFAVAALTALMFAALATVIFGIESWALFIASMDNLYTGYSNQTGEFTPALNMTTLMSQLLLLGVPVAIAEAMHGGFALIIVGVVAAVWRFCDASDLRAGVLCTGAILISPYVYSYEMIVLLAPIGVIIMRARDTGRMTFERPALLLGWALIPVLLNGFDFGPVQAPFALTLLCLVLIIRRAITEDKGLALLVKRIRGNVGLAERPGLTP